MFNRKLPVATELWLLFFVLLGSFIHWRKDYALPAGLGRSIFILFLVLLVIAGPVYFYRQYSQKKHKKIKSLIFLYAVVYVIITLVLLGYSLELFGAYNNTLGNIGVPLLIVISAILYSHGSRRLAK